jgi:hypothetical protein
MRITAWNNGKHLPSGAGYGLKVDIEDRDRWFDPKWQFIWLHLEGEQGEFQVNVGKKSFWTDACHELIHKNIGEWLIKNDLAPWSKGKPPKLELEHIKGNHLILRKAA